MHGIWVIQGYEENTRLVSKVRRVVILREAYSASLRELENLQNVVKTISTRNTATRFFLHDADIQVITACTTAIRAIYDKLEV